MQYRKFGNTDLQVSEIGFGAWAIGGPAMVGDMAIGWGEVNDADSVAAIHTALDHGINFFDTADFYGLGHSEALLGKTLGREKDVIIATKVGQKLDAIGNYRQDYSKAYIIKACEASLARLDQEIIDFYQLHTATIDDLINGECIEAMLNLKAQGKIRHWGLSLNTYDPKTAADYLIARDYADGVQLVLNLLNQRAIPIMQVAAQAGYGIIARMPLQFGLLTGKFNAKSTFPKNDHRSFRLDPATLALSLPTLEYLNPIQDKYSVPPVAFSISFVLSHPEVSTVIPGMRNSAQVISNTTDLVRFAKDDLTHIHTLYYQHFSELVDKL